ncbi:MAG: SIMPL domain-containing protein [Erythrobacter sp.]|nr:SIMPL domain-containing protein [Erythrobacter sp.]
MIRPAMTMLAASALAIPAHSLAAAEIAISADGPVVELNVFESVSVAPDIATIGAGVTSEAPTATEALRQNSAEMQKVIARIKALGVADKDIQTTGINLNAMYDYNQEARRQVFRGYQASNRVSVILRKIDDAGKVLDALVAAGATDLNGPSFSIENDEDAKDTARKRAIERAQARVQAYADLFGYDGAKVLAIAESIEGRGSMPEMAKMRVSADMAAAAPPVQPGMVSTGISITIKYELVKDTPAVSQR